MIGALGFGVALSACCGVARGGEGVMTAEEARAVVSSALGSDGGWARAHDAVDLTVGGYTQFRYLSSFGTEDDAGGPDGFEAGFQFERTRLVFSGTVHEDIGFTVVGSAGRDSGFGLLDAVVTAGLGDSGWKLTAGQQKLPFYREWLVSAKFILPVERSNQTAVFSSGFAQALKLGYVTGGSVEDDGGWRFGAAFSDGLRSVNTAFTDAIESDFALTARGEWLAFGDFGMFKDLTALGNEGQGLMVGAAVHYQGDTESIRGVDISEIFQYTADVSWETAGGSLLVAFVGRHAEGANGFDADDFGVLVQGALFVRERTELFGRYDVLVPDDDAAGDESFHTVTAGVNHYIHGHAVKLTLDIVWQPEPTGQTTMLLFNETNAGTGQRRSDNHNQYAVRGQVQIVF